MGWTHLKNECRRRRLWAFRGNNTSESSNLQPLWLLWRGGFLLCHIQFLLPLPHHRTFKQPEHPKAPESCYQRKATVMCNGNEYLNASSPFQLLIFFFLPDSLSFWSSITCHLNKKREIKGFLFLHANLELKEKSSSLSSYPRGIPCNRCEQRALMGESASFLGGEGGGKEGGEAWTSSH